MPTPEFGESEEEYMKRCMAHPDLQQLDETQRAAVCHSKYAKGAGGDSMPHRIGFDTTALDGKIIVDDDKRLVMRAVIASEIVQQYEDGWAYKPAEELEKMAAYAQDIGSVPVKILEHPNESTKYLLLKHSDVHGRADNFQYVKNLVEPKTGRPCRRGVTADISWFKSRVDAVTLEKTKKGTLHDVSIGFTFDSERTRGEFNGAKYDYIQRNIFLNHVAAPIEAGRCPGPICGIGYDAKNMIQVDAQMMVDCPVCSRMKSVGFGVAGKRLYKQYGPDVLEVIEGHDLPKFEPVETSLDEEFNQAFAQLKRNLSNSP